MLKQFGWIAGGRVIAAGLQLLTMTMVAREAGPSKFGVLAVALGVIVVAQTLFDFGVTTFILRHRAQEDFSDVRGALHTGLWLALLMAATLVLLGLIAGVWVGWSIALIAVLLGVWGAMDRAIDVILAIPTGAGDSTYTTISLVLRRGVVVLCLFLSRFVTVDPIQVFAISSICGSMFVLLLGIRGAANKGYFSSEATPWRRVLPQSRHYWFGSLAVQLRNLDSVIVAFAAGTYVSGQYGIASRVTTPLRIIPTSFAVALLPHAAKSKTRTLRNLAKPLLGIMVITALLFLGLAAAYPWISTLLLGSKYDDSILAVQLVCVSLAFAAVESQLASIMNAWDMSRDVARSAWVATLFCLVAVGPASILWGASGAGAVLGGVFVLNAIQLIGWYAWRKHKQKGSNDKLGEMPVQSTGKV